MDLGQRLVNRERGFKLVREALGRADYETAWKHVIAYDLNEFDIIELALPEKYRPASLRNRPYPKAGADAAA